ncbi:MAG: apolipoprotein N-acyltransferase [Nocardioidaceae bacterium]|nr:apolipoprotein N-acyltransferase [Nocardioidaceae bacterium]
MPSRAPLIPVAAVVVSAGCGLAVAVAFPPFGFWWLMPVGLAGLMVTIRGRRVRGGFAHGLAFGLGNMLPLMGWLTIIGVDAWILLSLLEALFYGAMGVAWACLRPHRWWPLGFAVTWVGAEVLRGVVPFGGMPWGTLAFGLVDTAFVRYGRLGGTALVSFLALLVVALLVSAVERRRGNRWYGVVGSVGALVVVGLSLVLPTGPAGGYAQVRVAAVQGNVPGAGLDPFFERRAVLHNHAATTESYAEEVAQGTEPRPDLVIWPENSTDIDPYADDAAYREISAAVRAIAAPTLVGALVVGPDEDHVQNVGIVWDPRTGPGERYVKRHPVPFGEYIPFRDVLTMFIDRLDQIPRDFTSGQRVGVLDLGGVVVGDVICFEVAYDGLIRDVVDHGAELLVVQTNNATYTGTGQLEQQFAISRYRAVETGRALVVAATNGISGVIAADGTVLDVSAPRTRDVLSEEVTLARGVTLGVRLGFTVELVLALLGLASTAYAYLDQRGLIGKMKQ